MKIGIDPEFFILDENSNPINAIRVLPGKSFNPLKKNGINFYHDNVLAEFNYQPVKSEIEFLEKTGESIRILRSIVHPYDISIQSFAEFNKHEMALPNAKEVGCNPDYDAYTLTQNDQPTQFFTKTNNRAAGGHFHIGGEKTDAVCHPFMKPIFVFMLDLFVGIPSVAMDHSVSSFRRRKVFGQAGSHRDKPYGLEYRVLSPFWLRSRSTASLMYKLIDFVFESMNDEFYKKFWNFYPDRLRSDKPATAFECYGYDHKAVVNAINDNDSEAAKRFCNFIMNFMPDHLVAVLQQEINFRPDGEFYNYWI
jgi:hypothetical protein